MAYPAPTGPLSEGGLTGPWASALRVPRSFRCPLSGGLMRDPVVSPVPAAGLPAGTSFERAALMGWHAGATAGTQSAPLPVPPFQLLPNASLRAAISEWLEAHGLDAAAAEQLLGGLSDTSEYAGGISPGRHRATQVPPAGKASSGRQHQHQQDRPTVAPTAHSGGRVDEGLHFLSELPSEPEAAAGQGMSAGGPGGQASRGAGNPTAPASSTGAEGRVGGGGNESGSEGNGGVSGWSGPLRSWLGRLPSALGVGRRQGALGTDTAAAATAGPGSKPWEGAGVRSAADSAGPRGRRGTMDSVVRAGSQADHPRHRGTATAATTRLQEETDNSEVEGEDEEEGLWAGSARVRHTALDRGGGGGSGGGLRHVMSAVLELAGLGLGVRGRGSEEGEQGGSSEPYTEAGLGGGLHSSASLGRLRVPLGSGQERSGAPARHGKAESRQYQQRQHGEQHLQRMYGSAGGSSEDSEEEDKAAEAQVARLRSWLEGAPAPAVSDLYTLLRSCEAELLAPAQIGPLCCTSVPCGPSAAGSNNSHSTAAALLLAMPAPPPPRVTAMAVLPPPPPPPSWSGLLGLIGGSGGAGGSAAGALGSGLLGGAASPLPRATGRGGAGGAGGSVGASVHPHIHSRSSAFAVLITRDRPSAALLQELPADLPTPAPELPHAPAPQPGPTGRCWALPAVRGRVTAVAACPRGGSVAVGSSAGLVALWRGFEPEALAALREMQDMSADLDTAGLQLTGSGAGADQGEGAGEGLPPPLEWHLCGRLGWPEEVLSVSTLALNGTSTSTQASTQANITGIMGSKLSTGSMGAAMMRRIGSTGQLVGLGAGHSSGSSMVMPFMLLTPHEHELGFTYTALPPDSAGDTAGGRRQLEGGEAGEAGEGDSRTGGQRRRGAVTPRAGGANSGLEAGSAGGGALSPRAGARRSLSGGMWLPAGGSVTCLAASPCGAHLAAGLADGSVHLALHAAAAERVVLAFSPDERRLLVLALGLRPGALGGQQQQEGAAPGAAAGGSAAPVAMSSPNAARLGAGAQASGPPARRSVNGGHSGNLVQQRLAAALQRIDSAERSSRGGLDASAGAADPGVAGILAGGAPSAAPTYSAARYTLHCFPLTAAEGLGGSDVQAGGWGDLTLDWLEPPHYCPGGSLAGLQLHGGGGGATTLRPGALAATPLTGLTVSPDGTCCLLLDCSPTPPQPTPAAGMPLWRRTRFDMSICYSSPQMRQPQPSPQPHNRSSPPPGASGKALGNRSGGTERSGGQ
eukprot:XP_001702803.1 predicted protein [Chlamydomonas reinhardtii]